MADQARVTSVEALERFRTSLIIFATKAKARVDEVGDEIRRTRVWVQSERRLFWENETRRRRKMLDQAQQELMSARISNLRDNLQGQTNAVRKAQHAVDEAEGKLRNVKLWNRNYESSVEPLSKRLEGLRRLLEDDLPKAAALLMQMEKSLEAYGLTSLPPDFAASPKPETASAAEEPSL